MLRRMIIGLMLVLIVALPAAVFLWLKNIEVVSNPQNKQVTLFLKKNIAESQAKEFFNTLKTRTEISDAKLISPNEGLKELQQKGFADATTELQENPLPWVILFSTASINEAEFKKMPEVESLTIDLPHIKQTFTVPTYRLTDTLILLAAAVALGLAAAWLGACSMP